MNAYIGIGHFMHDSCRLMSKKLEQAQKRQKKHEVDQCQSQSSSIAEVSSQDEAPAAKRLGADSRQKQMCLLLQTRINKALVNWLIGMSCVVEECAAPVACTERHRKVSSFRSSLSSL